jgi:uncharacterized membrane-anchored protein
MRSKLSVAGMLLVLLAVNAMIARKESALARGRTVILELAPVDPRSLMQGDYMALRYALAEKVAQGEKSSGTVYLTLDSRNVATSLSSVEGPGLVPLQFRRHDGRVLFDTESYFFQEGQGHFFQGAKYGELKVDEHGTPMLVGLLGPDLQPINP